MKKSGSMSPNFPCPLCGRQNSDGSQDPLPLVHTTRLITSLCGHYYTMDFTPMLIFYYMSKMKWFYLWYNWGLKSVGLEFNQEGDDSQVGLRYNQMNP